MSKKISGNITHNSYAIQGNQDNEASGSDNSTDSYEEINIILIGNCLVGKTSLLFKFTADEYTEVYMPTVGIDHRVKIIESNKGKKVKVKIWDTSGNEKTMESIGFDLYKHAAVIIVMFDVTNIKSYNDIYHWMNVVENHALSKSKLIFLGNKTDEVEKRKINKLDGIYLASSYGGKYMEISVYKNRNIQKTFRKIVSNLCDQ